MQSVFIDRDTLPARSTPDLRRAYNGNQEVRFVGDYLDGSDIATRSCQIRNRLLRYPGRSRHLLHGSACTGTRPTVGCTIVPDRRQRRCWLELRPHREAGRSE